MSLEMRQPISVKREHPADQMINDVSTAIGTSTMSDASREYFRILKSSVALDAERGLKIMQYRLLVENESVHAAS